MAYKLAIAISGAVSLGSYEAGVAYEIVNAIAQHNKHNVDNPEACIHIDVLSGASAGGMTAAILAQKLLFEGHTLDNPYDNVLYNAWVKQVDIESLLSDQFQDDPNRSLLSSNFIRHMADSILLKRYDTPNPTNDKHLAAAPTILLGLAMANLNGIDYAVDAFNNSELESEPSQFVQTRFQDSFTRTIDQHQDKRHVWQEVIDAALGCGAFPTAFAPVKLQREYKEPDYFGKAKAFAKSAFTYVDGGTFNNYPLGMAKNLVDTLDTEPLAYEKRFYLYISPNSKVSTKTNFDGDTASIFTTAGAISNAIFNQARFQDWIMTSKVNDLIKQFDRRADALGEHFLMLQQAQLQALDTTFNILLDKIFAFEPARDQAEELATLHQRFNQSAIAMRLRQKFGEEGVAVWLSALHVLEASGRLQDKDHMHIYTITAAMDELASDGLFAFIGFLDRRFREHDYNVGRVKARNFLQGLKKLNTGVNPSTGHHLPIKDFEFADELPDLPNLGMAGIADVHIEVRKQLYSRNHQRLNLWFKQAGMSKFLRWLLLVFIDKKAKKFLKL